jgi:hypothetical protein
MNNLDPVDARPLCDQLLTRREALIRVGAWLGGSMIGGSVLLSGCATLDSRPAAELFSNSDIDYMDEIADTILPETSTPGAKAAKVGAFIAIMVADTYTADEQAIFSAGLDNVDSECRRDTGIPFMAATRAQRQALLERLDREQFDYMQARAPDLPVHYFRMIKELTLQGYYTSEIGYKQAMRYIETPGAFEPCVPYTAGDRAWASHA